MAFGIDEGPSGEEGAAYNAIFGTSGWAANQGEQDVTSSDAFMQAILSGDPAKIGQFLGPQERAIQQQGQQKKQVNAQFGNRGGGTNASNQTIGDTTTSSINDMISKLTGTAVSGLSSNGTSLVNSGLTGIQDSFGDATTMQEQRGQQWNDIFNSVASVGGAVAGGVGNIGDPGNFGTGASQFFQGAFS